jgi:hypothetical protein
MDEVILTCLLQVVCQACLERLLAHGLTHVEQIPDMYVATLSVTRLSRWYQVLQRPEDRSLLRNQSAWCGCHSSLL